MARRLRHTVSTRPQPRWGWTFCTWTQRCRRAATLGSGTLPRWGSEGTKSSTDKDCDEGCDQVDVRVHGIMDGPACARGPRVLLAGRESDCRPRRATILKSFRRLRKSSGARRRLTDSPAHFPLSAVLGQAGTFPLSPLRPERRDWLTLVASAPGCVHCDVGSP